MHVGRSPINLRTQRFFTFLEFASTHTTEQIKVLIHAAITIGAMTMYAGVFKAAQSAMSSALGDIGGMYEDNLYLSNLYEYLEQPVRPTGGSLSAGGINYNTLKAAAALKRLNEIETLGNPSN